MGVVGERDTRRGRRVTESWFCQVMPPSMLWTTAPALPTAQTLPTSGPEIAFRSLPCRLGVLPGPVSLARGNDRRAAEQGAVEGERRARSKHLVKGLVCVRARWVVETYLADARVTDRDVRDVVVPGAVAGRRAVDVVACLVGDGNGDTARDGASGRQRRPPRLHPADWPLGCSAGRLRSRDRRTAGRRRQGWSCRRRTGLRRRHSNRGSLPSGWQSQARR